jgi:hypothetical protein
MRCHKCTRRTGESIHYHQPELAPDRLNIPFSKSCHPPEVSRSGHKRGEDSRSSMSVDSMRWRCSIIRERNLATLISEGKKSFKDSLVRLLKSSLKGLGRNGTNCPLK